MIQWILEMEKIVELKILFYLCRQYFDSFIIFQVRNYRVGKQYQLVQRKGENKFFFYEVSLVFLVDSWNYRMKDRFRYEVFLLLLMITKGIICIEMIVEFLYQVLCFLNRFLKLFFVKIFKLKIIIIYYCYIF